MKRERNLLYNPVRTMNFIADAADPLAPFMHALLWKAVPTLILCGIIGMILGDLRKHAENWIERGVRRLFHKPAQPEPSARPQPNPPSAAAAPHCPSCNAPMVPRQGKRGARAGERFWGCSTYPACRGTRSMQSAG